jgi:hypothetical protein
MLCSWPIITVRLFESRSFQAAYLLAHPILLHQVPGTETPPHSFFSINTCVPSGSLHFCRILSGQFSDTPPYRYYEYLLCSLTRSGAYRLWEKSATLPASGEDPAPHTCTRHICELMIPGPSITPITMSDPTKGAW